MNLINSSEWVSEWVQAFFIIHAKKRLKKQKELFSTQN